MRVSVERSETAKRKWHKHTHTLSVRKHNEQNLSTFRIKMRNITICWGAQKIHQKRNGATKKVTFYLVLTPNSSTMHRFAMQRINVLLVSFTLIVLQFLLYCVWVFSFAVHCILSHLDKKIVQFGIVYLYTLSADRERNTHTALYSISYFKSFSFFCWFPSSFHFLYHYYDYMYCVYTILKVLYCPHEFLFRFSSSFVQNTNSLCFFFNHKK